MVTEDIFKTGFKDAELFLFFLKKLIKDKLLLSKISKAKIIALAKKYKDFPTYNLLSNFSDIVTLQLPFIMVPQNNSSTTSIALVVYGKLKTLASWQYLYLISSIILFSITYLMNFEFKKFLVYYVYNTCLMYGIYLFLIIKIVKTMDSLIIKDKVDA